VLNSSHSELVSDPSSPYDGFRSGYAANVARVDQCFGGFVSYLKQSGQYDNSIIAITADHGESLGEDGNYGHQFWLFPEDIRIPLMISMPASLRSTLTTDTGRIAFSTDLVPTLLRLLGDDVRDVGPLSGSPLVTETGNELPPRRRQPYVVMSSYGASYGMLRRNGKFLFIADLINYREHAFELFQQPVGTRATVTDDLRRINQALIQKQVEDIEAFYTPH
jgi:arylsulfatase A-like enzyme